MPAVAATRPATVGAAFLLRLERGDLRRDHCLLHPAEQVPGLGQRQAEPLRLQAVALQRGDLVDEGTGVGLGLDDDLDAHAHGHGYPGRMAMGHDGLTAHILSWSRARWTRESAGNRGNG